jgi:hypothetical protein
MLDAGLEANTNITVGFSLTVKIKVLGRKGLFTVNAFR